MRSILVFLLAHSVCGKSTLDSPPWAAGLPRSNDAEMHRIQFESKNPVPPPRCTTGGAGGNVRRLSPEETADEIREGPLDIFILPHTHDDVGWLQTVSGYFGGSVTHILSSVTEELSANPAYRFIWSETKWFELWWPLQNTTTQGKFREIVRSGQFEFVGAGWSQSDEVTPSYRDIIDNTVTGHEFLRRTLGDACPDGRCVRFGWQIDMFAGYSATTPSLWRMMGYDAMVIRFEGDDAMRNEWDRKRQFEFLWEGGATLDSDRSRILTHVIR
jgi:hypothetical protein